MEDIGAGNYPRVILLVCRKNIMEELGLWDSQSNNQPKRLKQSRYSEPQLSGPHAIFFAPTTKTCQVLIGKSPLNIFERFLRSLSIFLDFRSWLLKDHEGPRATCTASKRLRHTKGACRSKQSAWLSGHSYQPKGELQSEPVNWT